MKRSTPFTAVRTEGALLPPDLLARVVANDQTLPGIDPAAYHRQGERLNEVITHSWNRLTGAWSAFQAQVAKLPEGDRATTPTRDWMLKVFDELSFGRLQSAKAVEIGGNSYAVSHRWEHVPIHIVGQGVTLDAATAGVAGAARMSPHGLVQDLLNRSSDHLWAFVSNGNRLRLLRDHASLTRQAYLEFDLAAIFDGQIYSDFVLLWLVCHQSRFEGDPPEKCLLERWVADAAQRGTRALDDLRRNVEAAITEMGTGFLEHPANAELRHKLNVGELTGQDYYRQLLRLVYRLLFLSVAEARDLLCTADDSVARDRYRSYYSLDRLRTLGESRRGGQHSDLWVQLLLVMRALGSDAGEPALALPALGSFLWRTEAIADLDAGQIANRRLLDAIRALSRIETGKVVHSIDYANLGAEELGSVYESLLALHPELHVDGHRFALSTASGNERKTTGSYYTPTSLINELLDSALEPVLAEAASSNDPETAILELTVLDPACGSGHFLIAAAQRIAKRLAAARCGEDEPSPDQTRRALRDVVAHCLYGVDVNPMAVELCKVSLWMEAMEPGKPLSFLEHKIVCGNSLLGTTPALLSRGVPDEAFKPLTGDDRALVTAWKKANKKERSGQTSFAFGASAADLAKPLATELAAIDAIDATDAQQVREQEQRFSALQASGAASRARLHADAWCAAFVAPKTQGASVITDAVVQQIADDPSAVDPAVIEAVDRLREQYRFLHLHLAFPTVFRAQSTFADDDVCGWDGGFSVVLGNPPWEKVKLSEKEFFAARSPEIAAAAGAKRKKLIATLEGEDPELWSAFQDALRTAEGESHLLRSSGRYPLCGRGDVNTYAVFAENMRNAVGPRGRLGVIVPTGIATDDTTKFFFADCVDSGSLVSLYGFDHRTPYFGKVLMQFCLLTLTGRDRPIEQMDFAFGLMETSDLAEPDRCFTLTPEDIALINPNTKTAPVFRSRRDAELTAAIYRRVPVLVRDGDPEGNPWGVEFATMFHMTNDSHLFRTADELRSEGATLHGNIWVKGKQRWLPLYEAKMAHHFNHRFGDYALADPNSGDTSLPTPSDDQLADPCYVVQPRYWVPQSAVGAAMRDENAGWLLGFRDICRSTDERTMIASLLSPTACGHKLPLIWTADPARRVVAAAIGSFAFDFVARQKVGGTNLAFFTLKQLALPEPVAFSDGVPWSPTETGIEWLAPRVLELSYAAWDLEGFARDLGYEGPPFRWDPARRELLRAELDAACFHLYGIERGDVDYIMATFPIVKRKDIAAHGEYRTKRLILEVYDAMADAIETGKPYQTILDPPPADPSCAHPASTRPDWADLLLEG